MAVQANSTQTFRKLPGMFSFSRGIVVTDAEFFNDIQGEYEPYPVKVIRHGIRGTQNTNDETGSAGSTRDVRNVQQTDSAKLDPRAEALVVRFMFRPLALDGEQRYALASGKEDNDAEIGALRDSVDSFIARSKGSDGLREVSRRFARNLVNGRWLWRNRTLARSLEVQVYRNSGPEVPDLETMDPLVTVDGLQVALNHFDDYSDDEETLGEAITLNLAGEREDTFVVLARLTFGAQGALEVFPSQNYIERKPTGFARPLYRLGAPERETDPGRDVRVMGNAAMRDQKIANALRTIDTWYPDFAAWGRPIPVEPNGANLDANRFFRGEKHSAFQLFTRLNQIDPDSDDGQFCVACLLRGGVYSGSREK